MGNRDILIWKDERNQESWCGCATPGNEVLPCGHCACGNGLCLELVRNGAVFEARRKEACNDILIWKDERNQESWCGCAAPGNEVLSCGHCACGNGLCLELVRNGAVFEARRKEACSESELL